MHSHDHYHSHLNDADQPALWKSLSKIDKLNFRIVFVLAATVAILIGFPLIEKRLESSTRIIKDDFTGLAADEYYLAEVEKIIDENGTEIFGQLYETQTVKVKVLNGEDKGKEVEIINEIQPGAAESQKVKAGERVVITNTTSDGQSTQFISDRYRFTSVVLVFVVFFGLIVIFTGIRGLSSVLALVFTLVVLIKYVVPSIFAGNDPVLVSLVGTLVIGSVTLYLSHGFSRRTSIALAGTLITIFLGSVLGIIFVHIAQLSGGGSEEAFFLKMGVETINLRGLLLGGIIFGTLGILDDVTTAQAASVEQLKKANAKYSFKELYTSAMEVGKEHILALVNTLVLAYVGSSFPILLLFSLNQTVPLWVTLNSEFVIEEIMRTLIGSSALIFAVPITTLIAAYVYSKDLQFGDIVKKFRRQKQHSKASHQGL